MGWESNKIGFSEFSKFVKQQQTKHAEPVV